MSGDAGPFRPITTNTDDERRRLGVPRNGHTPCAADGCGVSPANGGALTRVNPKGEAGIFMCHEHAAQVEREDMPR